jgi:hypothetical protein
MTSGAFASAGRAKMRLTWRLLITIVDMKSKKLLPIHPGEILREEFMRPLGLSANALASAKTERDPVFGFDIVTDIPGVPSEILRPRESWADKAAYDATAKKLAGLFNKNFKTYAAGASAEVKAAAPVA